MASAASNLAASIASKTKTKKKHFVSQKVKLFRASDPLLSVLMWGVNHSINELSHIQIPVMLMPDDFKANSKIKVDNHLFNKAPIPSDAQGRSGARFHTSYNKRYVIKIITSEDVAEMHNILKKYHQYIVECHGNTLLPQFLGMYRLTVDGDETYMIVTRNVFSHRLPVYKKYDLKGSTVAREATDREKPRPPEEAPSKSRMSQKLQTIRIATRFYCAIRHVRTQQQRTVPYCSVFFFNILPQEITVPSGSHKGL
ncbi:hypothetical protein cypCar_00020616 [Cyprinus carpio]|nr:hypothetical protein cypCar_00020616 [Cyprinus carpio]